MVIITYGIIMQLNTFTDLGIRTLIYLVSVDQSKNYITITELSEILNAKRMHLIKVIHFMSSKNWIKTVRGKNGGLYLLDDTKNIYIGNIIYSLENYNKSNEKLIDCRKLSCPLISICRLPNIFKEAQDDFYSYLNKYTLEDLINNSK